MRTGLLLVLIIASAGASASFDMMLMSNFATRKIHRYDPQNGIYLGSFDSVGQTTSLVMNQANSEVYALTEGLLGTGIARYNVWTGEYLGIVPLPTAWGAPFNMSRGAAGEVLVSTGLDVYRVNPLTGAQIGSSLFYTDRKFTYPARSGYLNEGNYMLYGNSDGTVWNNDYVMAISPNGGWQGSWLNPTFHSSNVPRDLVTRGNEALAISQSPSLWQIHRLRRTGSSSFGGQVIAEVTPGRSLQFVEYGHGDSAYYTYRDTATGIMGTRAFGTVLGNLGPDRSFTFTDRIDGTAIFLAPEPASLSALAIGVVALLRRKKRSS